ncbi:tripartite tricarboxylate transporter substrate-binding protein [Variovorax sp. LjRoot84]|uniref:Bug family tripartite tricarboxylate transporter substrate binding protein n=1 Tax=Variovorax sp. LjRoot84 TaxID=3342340 RepID=UPI003ECC20AB
MNFSRSAFHTTRRKVVLAGGFATLLAPLAAVAQGEKPLSIVVAYPAGSAADVMARALGHELGQVLNVPVIVENKTGANQIVAATYVARAQPAGRTLFLAAMPSVIPPALQGKLPFAGLSDFAPVASLLTIQALLAVRADFPAKDIGEFVSTLKANPGKYSYGSAGVGSPLHLFCEELNAAIGAKSIHVPYGSGQAALLELTAGRLDYAMVPVSAHDFVASGKLKVLGTTGLERAPELPEVPSLHEGGLKGFEATFTYVLLAGRETPQDEVGQLNKAINAVKQNPGFVAKLKTLGGIKISKASDPNETRALVSREEKRWNDLVKVRKIEFN